MSAAPSTRDGESAATLPAPQPFSARLRYLGRAFVPLSLLRQKLGCSALQVWQGLLLLRDVNNTVHVTRAGLGHMKGFAELPDRVVQKALQRLRSMCLVQDIGWRVLRVPERGQWVEREVFVRRVYGTRGQSEGTPVVEGAYVPREAARLLGVVAGWGGARHGAGRKPRLLLPPTGGAEVPTEAPAEGLQEPVAGGIQEPPMANQEGPIGASETYSRGSTDRTLSSPLERSEFLPTEETPARGSARGFFEVKTEPEAPPAASLDAGRLGTSPAELPGLPWEAILLVAGRGVVPPFPGQELVAPASVPDPPRLRAELSPRSAATVLVRAYRGALESRYGRKATYRLPPESVMVERELPLLTSAVALLTSEEIAPAAWAAWSVDVWRDYVASKSNGENPPRLSYVFGAKRLGDHKVRGWFAREGGAAAGGRVIFTPEHRALVLRWQRMKMDASRRGAVTPSELAAVADRWFPPGAFDAAVRRARESASREERALRDRVERGEFVW